ncbi:hypothetical protein MKX03_030334 [Papaver bracteatum]|nr:hypothetical protein MKX03_030334 [Papaver bracteatum]
MPLTRLVADAFGVVTICLVSLLVLLGLFCILYSIYFRTCTRNQSLIQLGYFNKPWIIRITLILYAFWWGFGEVGRLTWLRRRDRVVYDLGLKWQQHICKFYVLSNLGIAEPCLLLTIVFLLRASLQKRESGTLSRQWNAKTAGYVLLTCLPIFLLQCILVLAGPKFNDEKSHGWKKKKMPHYFTSTSTLINDDIAMCTYPLLSTIALGLFATISSGYLLLLGRRMASSVINKGLQKRALFLICMVSGVFPIRVILLGLSVLSLPEHFLFEALVFFAFLVLLVSACLGICMLVYCPIADSLRLKRDLGDLEFGRRRRRRSLDDQNDTASLIANQVLLEASSVTSLERNSDASAKRGSISFRTMLKDETPNAEAFEEVSLFSSAHRRQLESPPASPPAPGQPMLPLKQKVPDV